MRRKRTTDLVFDVLALLFRALFDLASSIVRIVFAVVAFPFRLAFSRRDRPSPVQRKAQPVRGGEASVLFQEGARYYDKRKNRVFTCVMVRGQKRRRVLFSSIGDEDFAVQWKKDVKDSEGFRTVFVENGIEVCERGAIRADRQATEKEVAEDVEFLAKLRNELSSDKNTTINMTISYGDNERTTE